VTAGQIAVAVLAALAALPVMFYAGWSFADWLANRRDLDRVEQAARQRLLAALTDPPPRRWT
jgi:hypothetical protein